MPAMICICTCRCKCVYTYTHTYTNEQRHKPWQYKVAKGGCPIDPPRKPQAAGLSRKPRESPHVDERELFLVLHLGGAAVCGAHLERPMAIVSNQQRLSSCSPKGVFQKVRRGSSSKENEARESKTQGWEIIAKGFAKAIS